MGDCMVDAGGRGIWLACARTAAFHAGRVLEQWRGVQAGGPPASVVVEAVERGAVG